MAVSSADLKAKLMEQDADFRHLVEKHRQLDKKIEELDEQILLTTEQKMETVTLKKKKLHLKDMIGVRLAEFGKSVQ